MGRSPRAAEGGLVYHAWNRANAGLHLFEQDDDYKAFEEVLAEARKRFAVPLLAFCLLPEHWHLVVQPERDGDLCRFLGWLTQTHTRRRHARDRSAGHLYQGRFRSFPVQADHHFLTVCRYVERNPVRLGWVPRAEEWCWSSLWRRERGSAEATALLGEGPVARPEGWAAWVNAPEAIGDLQALRRCLRRGRPFGSPSWVQQTAERLGLGVTLRPRGRPRR